MLRFLNKTDSNAYKTFFLKVRISAPVQCFRCKSHYSSLGLDSTASQKDIKSAYYKLSLKFHPDKNNGSAESVAKFREIAEAYEVLGNPDKKRVYDRDFQSGMGDFKSGTYSDFNRGGFNRYGSYYRPPRTGRDQYYNYEEHIRQHYEKFYRQREAEHEQFRRRWEADQRERHGEHWSNYYRQSHPPPPRMQLKELIRTKAFLYTFTLWIVIFFASLSVDGDKVKNNKPIYYNVPEKNKIVYYDVKRDDLKEE